MDDKAQRHRKLLQDILERIRDRLPPQQAAGTEIFVSRYYAFVPLEKLAKRDILDLYGSALAHWAFAQQRMQTILKRELRGESVEFRVHPSESMLARIEFIVRTRPNELVAFGEQAIEEQLIDAAATWQDELQASILDHLGEEQGVHLFQKFRHAFPAGYHEDFPARVGWGSSQLFGAVARDTKSWGEPQPTSAASGVEISAAGNAS